MINKKLMIFAIFLVSLLAVSAVSAQDNDTGDIASANKTADEYVSIDENQIILSENNDAGTFDDLQREINNAPESSVLNLTRDYNGAHGSRIQLNKNLTIDGQGHTLDCLGDDCSAFYSSSGKITLMNLKIINGHNDDNAKGGAIYIEGSAQYTLINCTFNKNWANDYGGAIYNGANKLTIIDCSFNNNEADDYHGGAIYSKGELDIKNSVFTSNKADDSGGAICSINFLNIINCTFLSNKADDYYGGAIYADGNTSISDSSFIDNYANKQGGAIKSLGFLNITNSTFRSNKVDYSIGGYGGAISTDGSTSISGSSFIDNSVLGEGGAIYSKHDLDIVNCSFTSNNAYTYNGWGGGAISARGNVVTIVGSNFTSNKADKYSGAIFARDRTENKPVYVKIIDSIFIENCCKYDGGALCVRGNLDIVNSSFIHNSVSDDAGGAIFCDSYSNVDSYTTVVDSTFRYNQAIDDGGAIHSNQDMTVIRSVFENNNIIGVNSEGGAIKSTEDVKIENSTFRYNHAPVSGGAIYADTITWMESPSYFIGNSANKKGGAIYTNKFETDVKYGVFINNTAGSDDDGGAIYINKENHLLFSQCYFENNKCGDEGGAIYLDSVSSTLYLENNIFVDNRAGDKGNIVYNKGKYDRIHNNWYGRNSFDFSNELVEYYFWGSDKIHKDDNPVTVELSLNETGQPSKLIVSFLSDGELFNYDAKFSADNGAILTNHKTGNNAVTSDIKFNEGITTVTATVNNQVLTLSYSFTKENVTMDINAPEISFGDNATVNVIFTPNNATGKVSVGNISSDIVDGAASVIIPDLSVGNYNLLVSYSGDGLYNSAQGNVTVTVNRKNLNIDASADPIHQGENATVIVTGLESATGNVTVTINNNHWTGKISNGTATIIIPGLSENTAADVTYPGDANYADASTIVNIIVNPKPKENLTISASADPIRIGEDATVVVTGLENATGNVTVNIGGDEWYGEINNGTATVIVTGLKMNATADVFYAGDYRYNNATTTVDITVNPAILVWYVNGSKASSGNGTTPGTAFKTLKEALIKAPENSTIYIAPGTYTGKNNTNLTIDKNLTFANYGVDEVIFDAQGLSRIWTVNAGRINITGLTFKNGKEEYVCGAIFFNQTLTDSYINAIFMDNSVVDGVAGAIGFYADVINTDINSVFINNSVNAGYGGAIFVNGNLSNVNISGNYTANTAGDYGGAILFYGDLNNVDISGNYTFNSAVDVGVIFFNGDLTDVNVSGYYSNNCANDTAGVFLFNSNLTNVVISGDYINNYAKDGINLVGEAYNVDMSGNYINNNVSEGSVIYIMSCGENSVIHDSIFINNTMDDELIIEVVSGSLSSVNNWFGNNATNYNIKPNVSENVTMVNWLFLNATTNTTGDMKINETAEVTFKLYAYDSASEAIREYDASKMNIELDLSPMRGTLNQPTAFINETILFKCEEKGIAGVTGKFETASCTIILARQSTEIIVNKTEITVTIGESVSAGAALNPPEAGNLTYASSNPSVAVVENGIIRGLKEGTAIITVGFAGNEKYVPAASKNITLSVEKIIPVIIAGADVADNRVSIHVDIDGYVGLISMDLFDSVVYLPINSSLTFEQILDYGVYSINITALGNDLFYPGSEILNFTVPEPEKLNTSISAQPSVNGNSVKITVEVDSNATGFVEIAVAGNKYYVPVDVGTSVFTNVYSAGIYGADITYLGDNKYNPANTTTQFSVIEQNETLKNTSIIINVVTGENYAMFTVDVNESATGLVELNIDGQAVYLAVSNGQVTYEAVMPGGDYTVTATYLGDDRFNGNSTTSEFTVKDHEKLNTTIATSVSVVNSTVTLTVNVNEKATGFVEISIAGRKYYVPVDGGNATFVDNYLPGTYAAEITYLGDDDFNPAKTSASFTVIEHNETKMNTAIDVEVYSVENNVTIAVNVNENATGLVEFNIGGEAIYLPVNNGAALCGLIMPGGDYTVTATYMGDSKFNSNTTSQDFTVKDHEKVDTTIATSVDVVNSTVTLTVNVNENATGFVEISIAGRKYYVPVDGGKATFVDDYLPGTYAAEITYLGDDDFNPAKTSASFTIIEHNETKKDTPIDIAVDSVENNVTITVNVDPEVTGLVEIRIGDESIYLPVNNGKVIAGLLMSGGDYEVTATYLGDNNFNANTTSAEFTVKDHEKINTTISAEAAVDESSVTLTVNVNESATGFVEISVAGKKYYVPVNGGKATFVDDYLPGTYAAEITYLGDDDFNPAKTSASFTIIEHNVTKKDTPIDISVASVENNVTITATVDSEATGLVEISIGDESIYLAINNGKVTGEFMMPGGDYEVTATYLGDNNFNANITSAEFTVKDHEKVNTTIATSVDVVNSTVTLTVNVNENATGFVEISVAGKKYYVPVDAGKAVFSNDYAAGTYGAEITYLGDDNFNTAVDSTSFTVIEHNVTKKDTPIDIGVASVENNVTITVTVDSEATGLVEISIGDESIYLPVNNGKVTGEFLLPGGDYEVTATYLGDSNFNANTTSAEFTVKDHEKINTTISAEATVDESSVTLIVNVNESATGFVEISVAGKKYYVPVDAGRATWSNDYMHGTYAAEITYLGDDDFNPAKTSASFTVIEHNETKMNTPISVEVASVENNVTVIVTVNENATGLIEINIDGEAIYLPVNNGMASCGFVLPGGDYRVTATYLGDAKFNANTTSVEFTVKDHEKVNTTIASQAAVDESAVTITVDVNENATGFVEISVAGKKYYAPVNDGKAIFANDYLPGTYGVDITYLGDGNFNPAKTSASFTIIEHNVTKKDTPIDISVDSVENNVTITVSVDPNATGLVEINVDGESVYLPLSNGVAACGIVLPAGMHEVSATYLGDAKFNANTTSAEFTVKDHEKVNTTIAAAVSVDNNTVTLTVTVNNEATGFVEISVAGKKYYVPVEKGKATLVNDYMPGTYAAEITYLGDDDFNPAKTSASFTIIEHNVTKKDTPIDISVSTAENNVTIAVSVDPNATGLVEISIGGEAIYLPVNNGEVTGEFLLPGGDYEVTATYLGDSNFNANTTSAEFTVNDHEKVNTTIDAQAAVDGNTVTITVNVNENATGFVEISIAGKKYYVPVENGKAVLVNDYLSGTYVADITYLGDDNYNTAKTSTSFTVIEHNVTKKDTPIDIAVDSIENNVTITVNIDPDATGLVEIRIGDETIYLPVNNGVAVGEFLLPGGDYEVTATYLGDDEYNANTTSVEFTVKDHEKVDPSIKSQAAVDGNTVTITVTVNDEATGFVEISIAGKKYYVPVENGKAVLVNDYLPGTYGVDVTYLGDDNYNTAKASTSFTVIEHNVTKKDTPIDIAVGSVENNVTITVSIDPDTTGLVEISIGDAAVYLPVNNGEVIGEFILDDGDYEVTATYLGDDKFNGNATSAEFAVEGHVKANTTIYADAISIENTAIITVNVNENATGFVELIIGPTTAYVKVEDGVARYNDVLPTGNYSFTATYLGDDNFNENTTEGTFTVYGHLKRPSNIDASVKVDGDNVSIDISVPDATGYVTLDWGDNLIYVPLENGSAVFEDEFAPGSYDVNITYYGDDYYLPSDKTVNFTIGKISTHLEAKYEKGTIYATVTDTQGNPVSGLKVGFAVNGVKYVTTDENGHANYALGDLAPGTYNIKVMAYGNDIYENSNQETVVVTKEQSKIYLRNALYFVTDTKIVKVTLWDGNSKPIAGKTVHITLNEYGLTYSGVTDENGDAYIRVGVGFGVHNATVSFDGDYQYASSNRTGQIKVIKETPSIMVRGDNTHFKVSTEPKIVKVYLWDRNSKPLPVNSKVAIKINGHTYLGYTDSNGIASIKINVNKPGVFNAEVRYAGNSAYNAVSRSVKFVIS